MPYTQNFKDVYEAFKGDTVNNAKIKQLAIKFKVHPDTGDLFTQVFTNSLQYCGLAKIQGDGIEIYNEIVTPAFIEDNDLTDNASDDSGIQGDEENIGVDKNKNPDQEHGNIKIRSNKTAAGVQVNLSLDSTMDAEKLEKFLKLLKNYGAI